MFSSAGTTSSRQGQGYSKVSRPIDSYLIVLTLEQSYAPQVPKGFTVRVFKDPSIYSFPQTPGTKFDRGYQSIPLAEPRQNTSSQTWHSRPATTSYPTPALAPSEPPKLSRPQASSSASFCNDNQLSKYDSNSRAAPPSYSIYQGSKDTYIYEASLSSKGDLYSNSEDDDATTAEYIPSFAFSPALSTDSITTMRGAITPDTSLTDLRGSTPTRSSSRTPFPLHIPSLAQAQTAIRGMFRSQTPNNIRSLVDNPHPPRSAGARPTSSAGSSEAVRSNTVPFRVSEPVSGSGSGERGAGGMPHMPHDMHASNDNPRQSHSRPRSLTSDAEDSQLDSIARANAGRNAAASSSRSGSSMGHYPSVRDSIHFPGPNSGSVGDATGRLYPNLPLRSSPEQQHAQATTPRTGIDSSYRSAPETAAHTDVGNTDPQARAPYPNTSDSDDTVSGRRYEQRVPWNGASQLERSRPATRPLPGEQASQAPRSQSNGPTNNRYVPASRTMTSNGPPASHHSVSPEPVDSRDPRHRGQDGYATVPPGRDTQRERRTSSASRISPTLSIPRVPAPHEGSGAGSDRPGLSRDETRRSSMERRASYMPSERVPTTHEPSSQRTSPQQFPTDHYAATQTPNRDPINSSRYVTTSSTRPSSTAIPHTPVIRSSPEQMHRFPSTQQPVPQSRDHAPPPTSGVHAASNYISSTATRRGPSPPRFRRDSIASPTSGTPRPPPVTTNVFPPPPQGHAQLDRRINPPRRQISIYEPQAAPSHDTHNQRVGEYGSRLETERQPHRNFVDPYFHAAGEHQNNTGPDVYSLERNFDTNAAPPNRTRYNSTGNHRPLEQIPHQTFAPPTTVSSDPGPEPNRHRMSSFAEQATSPYVRAEEGRRMPPPSPKDQHPETPAPIPERGSQAPFPPPLREPQRRYSDADSSVAGNSTYAPAYAGTTEVPRSTALAGEPQPQRRYSDGDQVDPSNGRDQTSLTIFRTVRWNENLVCPSPVLAHQRRKGWFNRRGDQLWTNDGAYKPLPQGHQYPPDLDGYPEHGEGWMNEQGVRIDMGHRLIPKAPLKSALKPLRTPTSVPL
ncbi:hypothetical protein C0991_004581 [Blastosporella zonata]|nr:hypothetical protein C0991_004581 [Blastosporella zonata]